MAVFAISDPHLSLAADKPMDIFGPRWLRHGEKLAEKWAATVGERDTVVLPGDISWAMTLDEAREDLQFLDRLPGEKIISRGNHDYWWSTAKKMKEFFASNGISTIKILYNNAYETEDFMICGSRGWYNDEKGAPRDADYAKIVARETARIELSAADAKKINPEKPLYMFLHFPPVFRDYLCREIVETLHKCGVKKCYWGHIHNVYDIPPSFVFEGIEFFIVSADYLGFTPAPVV